MDKPPGGEFRSVRENPWWIPPFLGGVPTGVSRDHLRLLGVLTFAFFFENYDLSILGNALPQLREAFDLSKEELGYFLGWVRLGALPALFLVALADRIGRRRLLLVAVVGMSIGSALTATSQTALQFTAFQFATRTFLISAGVIAVVILTEEFPAAHRGWGIGMMSGVAAIGFGAGALLYGFVRSLPLGWRALYLVGLIPLLLLPWLRRGVRETERFERSRGAQLARETLGQALAGVLRPIGALAREQPRRALALGLIGSLSSAGIGISFVFISEFLQSDLGWTPGGFAAMSIVFGAFGIVGNPAAGRLADRFGRRAVIVAALASFPLFAAAFYLGPSAVVALPWTAMVFTNMAAGVMMRALATELFPTAFRGSAGGTQAMLETLGFVACGFIHSAAMQWTGASLAVVTPLLALVTLVAAAAVWLVPETARRELEQISQEEPTA